MNHSMELMKKLKAYEGGDNRKAVIQLITTLSLYLAFITGMFAMVLSGLPYWMVLIAALPAGGLHMKIFVIMHDCGHNAYLTSTRGMRIVGRICAVITFTPYYDWLRAHAIHHATVSDLDKRGTGDVWTMTVDEYQASSRGKKILYRIYRNPLFLLGLGPASSLPGGVPISPKQPEEAVPDECLVDRPGCGRDYRRLLSHRRICCIPAGDTAHPLRRGGQRCLAVLHPAPIQGCVLGALINLGFHPSRAGGQFVLSPAGSSPMVFRQHRVPSHSPPESQNPQLQP
jgi:hypothetical protein